MSQEENRGRVHDHIALSLPQEAKYVIVKIMNGDWSFGNEVEIPVNRDNVRGENKIPPFEKKTSLVSKTIK